MITSFLLEHAKENTISFHMPGHKGSGIYDRYGYRPFLDRIMDLDITEIPGADNLFQAEGIIGETQRRFARLYGARNSYLLVNGTSGGLIAAVLATVPPGRKLIMARNCHKSVFNALTLGNIQPVFAYPRTMPGYGVAGAVDPGVIEALLAQNPDADAVLLPSPNYYGICSDVAALARVVHQAGKVLIVDQAHGAHLHFFHQFGFGGGRPLSAEQSGADIVVNSTHKTLCSFTQSAVLNLLSDRVDPLALEDKLQAIQTTSPSYLLMASLDICAEILERHGAELMGGWAANLDGFYKQAREIPGLLLMQDENLDDTKINLDFQSLGLDGARLEQVLLEHKMVPELYTGNLLMCMTGIGTTKEHLARLAEVLSEIPGSKNVNKRCERTGGELPAQSLAIPSQPEYVGIPKEKRRVPLQEAPGLISAASLIPYPPGIPFLCPGERITRETAAYLLALRDAGEKVIGISDQGEILAGQG